MTAELRILIAGCGSIGRRHLRNLVGMGMRNFILCDPDREALKAASLGLADSVLCENFSDALKLNPHAAVICTPSSTHIEMALELAKRGAHIFIEDPLSHTLEGCDVLEKTVEKNGVVGMMGMCYRFHPVFQHVKNLLDSEVLGKVYHVNYHGGRYLPDWHPKSDYRSGYAANRSLGGGAVLTGIHGLDNLRWLFGEIDECKTFVDRVSSLDMDVEDLAMGVFRTKSGVYVNWQTDFLQRADQHRMIIAGEKGTIRCDFIEGTIETFLVDFGKWFNGRLVYDINSMYVEEMKHFIECVEKRINPCIDIKEGIRTLKLALAVKTNGDRISERDSICLTA